MDRKPSKGVIILKMKIPERTENVSHAYGINHGRIPMKITSAFTGVKMNPILTDDVFDLIADYSELRKELRDTEIEVERLKQRKHRMEEKLFDWWRTVPEHLRPPHITTKDCGTVVFRTKDLYHVTDKEAFEEWRKDNNVNPTMLYRAHHSLLNSFIEEHLEAGNDMPAGVDRYGKETIQFRTGKVVNSKKPKPF